MACRSVTIRFHEEEGEKKKLLSCKILDLEILEFVVCDASYIEK